MHWDSYVLVHTRAQLVLTVPSGLANVVKTVLDIAHSSTNG